MEETNYHRQALAGNKMKDNGGGRLENHEYDTGDGSGEEFNTQGGLELSPNKIEEGRPEMTEKRRTLADKLKLFNKQELRYSNRLRNMVLRPLIFLSFPVISYAGFSYGSNLVWFNVLNGTTSLILSKEPYGFGSSIVGLAYIAPFIGMTMG